MIWTLLILAAILIPITAWAVNTQSPQGYTILTYCWVCLTAMGGCLVSILTNIREGRTRIFNIAVIGHMGSRGMAWFEHLLTAWVTRRLGIDQSTSETTQQNTEKE